MLPIAVIGGRYYRGIAAVDTSKCVSALTADKEGGKYGPIKPTKFQGTRAKMLEYAYEMSRKQ